MRIRICIKEAKECRYWLELIELDGGTDRETKQQLLKEATELMKIFGSICRKCEKVKSEARNTKSEGMYNVQISK